MYKEDSIVRNGVVILSNQADQFWNQEDETAFTNFQSSSYSLTSIDTSTDDSVNVFDFGNTLMPFESVMDSVPRVDTSREPFTTANVPSGALFEFNSPPRFTESWLKIYLEVGTPLHYTSCDSPSDFIYDDGESTTVSFTKFELYEGGYYRN